MVSLKTGLIAVAAMLLAGCQTTGQLNGQMKSQMNGMDGVTMSTSTHAKLSKRTMVAYASGLDSKPVKSGSSRFLVAHSKVQLGCLKPELVKLLTRVEKHYGKKVVITSGFRSKSYNRRVRGAKNSQHMYCKAADIRVPGVSKHALVKFARTLPGIGGVGLYCRSSYVHLDVGKRRDWHWGCGKKKRRRVARR